MLETVQSAADLSVSGDVMIVACRHLNISELVMVLRSSFPQG